MADDKPTTPTQADSPNPVGRPLKFKTVEELDKAIDAYFKGCDPHWVYDYDWVHKRNRDGSLYKDAAGQNVRVRLKVRSQTDQVPYTISGLALALGIDRKTLRSYKERPEFLPSIEAAKSRCESFWEGMLASPYSNGAKFNLTNNYDDWKEKQVLAGDPDAPLSSPYAQLSAADLRKLAESEDTQPDEGDAPSTGSNQT